MSASRWIFVGVAISLTLALHAYIWWRLVRAPGWPPPWRTVLAVLLVLFAIGMPVAVFVSSGMPPEQARWIAWPAFVWMGLWFLLVMFTLVGDVVALISHLAGRGDSDPARRTLILRAISGTVALAAGGLGTWAVVNGLRVPRVKEVRVALRRWPAARNGFTVVQLTDLHVGPLIHREWLEDVVARTNALEPDVVAITGDLMDGSVARLRDHIAPLAGLRAKHGVYFVTGNHEYYSGVDSWIRELTGLGVRVLRNERVTIGEGADAFDIAGIDDAQAHRFGNGHGADIGKAMTGRDPARAVVLLAHQPRGIEEAADLDVDLQLSGHTHAGQIWPFSYFVKLAQPFVAGLARIKDTTLYVSAGTGYWGPPMRLGTTSEITKLILERGDRASRVKRQDSNAPSPRGSDIPEPWSTGASCWETAAVCGSGFSDGDPVGSLRGDPGV